MCGLSELKMIFLKDELWMLSVMGAFQHSKIYESNKGHDEFKGCLRDCIECYILPQYYNCECVSEEQHIINLERIQDYSRLCNDSVRKKLRTGNIINNGKLSIGIVQKLFNLYLKYLWCIKEIPTPPHCPIDSTVMNAIGFKDDGECKKEWTKLEAIECCVKIIKSIKNKIGDIPIAYWELSLFNSKRKKYNCDDTIH